MHETAPYLLEKHVTGQRVVDLGQEQLLVVLTVDPHLLEKVVRIGGGLVVILRNGVLPELRK